MSWPKDRNILVVEHVAGAMLMVNNIPLLLMTDTELGDLKAAVEVAVDARR